MPPGSFDLDDYIDYVIEMFRHLGPGAHVMAVCQPSVPVLAAVALMSEDRDPDLPATMTLMGGPIDTRLAPTAVNKLAEQRGVDWFRRNTIMKVPFPHPGFMRDVYPGFLQLSGFMAMNFDRHVTAHQEFFNHLVDGDGDSAEKHREFYDEYLAVMDLTAEFYLQTVETVFVHHALPNGQMTHRGRPVRHRDDPAHGAPHRRGRARRHFRRRPDQGGARALHQSRPRQEAALSGAGRRPLRRLQRLALPRRDPAAHRRFHPQARCVSVSLSRGRGVGEADG